jgi:hypothetical protein
MEKVKPYSRHLLQSLAFASTLLLAAPAWGQAYSTVYPAPNNAKTAIYDLNLNNAKLFTAGVVTGQTADAHSSFPNYKDWRLLLTGLDGSVNGQRIFRTQQDDRAFESVRTSQGELMVIGHVGQGFTKQDRDVHGLNPTSENALPMLVRINTLGVPVLQRTFEMNGLDDHAYSIVRENDDSFLILGRSFRNVQQRYAITLLNVDQNGNVISAQMFRDDVGANFFPRKMLHTADGGFLIAAVREPMTNQMLHSPDPVEMTIIGKEVALIKLDAARTHVFTTLVSPADLEGIGVKDLVEDADENVTFVGTSAAGPYAMTIDPAGTIVQKKLLAVGSEDLKWEPKSIALAPGGFVVSGSVVGGVGVPRITLNSVLDVVDAERHQFGKDINSIEVLGAGTNFLGGATADDALVLRWMFLQQPPLCNVQDEAVSSGPFAIKEVEHAVFPTNITVTPAAVELVLSPAAVRVDNCAAPKMGAVVTAAQAAETNVQLAPNPAQDQLQVFVPGEAPAAYTLHDLQGRLLTSGTLRPGGQTLHVADFARGVYVLRVTNEQLNSTHRISLQH